jgi:hypothetical protein
MGRAFPLLGVVLPSFQYEIADSERNRSAGSVSSGLIRVRSSGSAKEAGRPMPMDRMSMRHVREGVRLTNSRMTTRDIARRVGVASSTLRRCEATGIAGNTQAENRCYEIRRRAENKAAKSMTAVRKLSPRGRSGERRPTSADGGADHRKGLSP